MTPALTIYTDTLPPDVGGCANAFVVRIRPKYKDDAGIHRHEYAHVWQWWSGVAIGAFAAVLMSHTEYWPFALIAGIALHPLAYLLFDEYRLHAEASAYAEQLDANGWNLDVLARRLMSPRYKLNLRLDEARYEILDHR